MRSVAAGSRPMTAGVDPSRWDSPARAPFSTKSQAAVGDLRMDQPEQSATLEPL